MTLAERKALLDCTSQHHLEGLKMFTRHANNKSCEIKTLSTLYFTKQLHDTSYKQVLQKIVMVSLHEIFKDLYQDRSHCIKAKYRLVRHESHRTRRILTIWSSGSVGKMDRESERTCDDL